MIPKECKRLAEVDFPIAAVSQSAGTDKYIRHKPTTTLHTWWAQRPLAACRAILLGLLLPDPCDEKCPKDFKVHARELLTKVPGMVGKSDKDLQRALLRFIGDFSNWDLVNQSSYLEVSRGLIKAVNVQEPPLVIDPFAGAGSIPFEAIRLGCEVFASDLNPVSCLIHKTIIEDIPQYGPQLAEDLGSFGKKIKEVATKELSDFYPSDKNDVKPVAYLWARAVKCEAPNCGVEIPLIPSFWLCKKAKRKKALRYKIIKSSKGQLNIEFEIFEPTKDADVPSATTARAKATCLCCGVVLSAERVKTQLANQRGGADVIFDSTGKRIGGAKLLAVVTISTEGRRRAYRIPTQEDYKAVWKAIKKLDEISSKKLSNGLSLIPNEKLPPIGTLGFRVQRYGMLEWGDLFTARQKLALVALGNQVREQSGHLTIKELAAFVIDKFMRHCNGNARWNNVIESVEPAFGTHTLPITWVFPETVPWGPWAENFDGSLEAVQKTISTGFLGIGKTGQSQLADAMKSPLPDSSVDVWMTDPPYYDAIPYADLSDFFFVWLKRMLLNHPLLCDPFNATNLLTPKDTELVQDVSKDINGISKDKAFFEKSMAQAFREGRRILKDNGIGCVVFAHKTTEGWEALLSGMIKGGWVITGSWPIATERAGRLRARESAALASSIHLICRPRAEMVLVGDWSKILSELPNKVGNWMERLQEEGVLGADLVFACIGPALEIFSKYSKVETAEGKEVTLAEYLEKVWEVVGRIALEHVLGTAEAKARNGVSGALEEDARLTALFLWTMQSTNSPSEEATSEINEAEGIEDNEEETTSNKATKGYSLIYDVARRFAQPLGIHLANWEGRIIETEKGIVRLLGIKERAEQLFGRAGIEVIAADLISSRAPNPQLTLFPEFEKEVSTEIRIKGKGAKKQKRIVIPGEEGEQRQEATTLDRVHAAMLFQATGQANALRKLLKVEYGRGSDFLRLANALSALYPKVSEEKRLIDAMLLAVPK